MKGRISVNSSTWIAIYLPLFMLFFVILPQQWEQQKLIIFKKRKRKELTTMTNEMIKKYVGKNCKISTGSFGTNITGDIIDIKENWIEVQTKKGVELINADFVQSIKINK